MSLSRDSNTRKRWWLASPLGAAHARERGARALAHTTRVPDPIPALRCEQIERARAHSQMSATDVARRTEMELKVDQKVLCGDIKRQETMGMELMERSKFDEYVRKTDELTRKTGEHVAG